MSLNLVHFHLHCRHHNPSAAPENAEEKKLEKAFVLFREAVNNCPWAHLYTKDGPAHNQPDLSFGGTVLFPPYQPTSLSNNLI
jgi:hypothetical protein